MGLFLEGWSREVAEFWAVAVVEEYGAIQGVVWQSAAFGGEMGSYRGTEEMCS